jgi:hypothetical protein
VFIQKYLISWIQLSPAGFALVAGMSGESANEFLKRDIHYFLLFPLACHLLFSRARKEADSDLN